MIMLINESVLLPYVEHMTAAQWGIMAAILISAGITGGLSLWNILQTRRAAQRQVSQDSLRILSDTLKRTSQFRTAVDHLIFDEVTENDHVDLHRVMTYLTVLARAREHKLVDDGDIETIYWAVLRRLTDEKIIEITGGDPDLFKRRPQLYKKVRTMRDQLV